MGNADNIHSTSALAEILKNFGCEVTQTDLPLMEWALNQAENYVKYELNVWDISEMPEKPFLNIAAGEYLRAKKTLDPKAFEGITGITPAIKRIEVGDTNTEFDTEGSSTPEQRFDLLTEYLIKSGRTQLEGYRRLKW